jgi:hypothetical protein
MSDSTDPENDTSRPFQDRREQADTAERGHAVEETVEKQHSRLRTATVVSIAAAIVSILSAGYSVWEGREQDRHARRMQLANVVEKLARLQQHPNEEYVVLARLTPGLLAGAGDDISSPEYAIMARAVRSSGDVNTALSLAKTSVDKAKTLPDTTWALRQYAFTLHQLGQSSNGDAEFGKALSLAEKFGSRSAILAERGYTLVDWEEAAATFGKCDQAHKLKGQLDSLLPALSDPLDKELINSRVEQVAPIEQTCSSTSSQLILPHPPPAAP